MIKQRIAVIFGGMSNEYEVSLMSAASVLENLPKEKYDVFPVGITKEGSWLSYRGDYGLIPGGEWENSPDCEPALINCDRSSAGLTIFPAAGGSTTLKVDVFFPVLHGRYGEDGAIQGLFALSGIPFVGSDLLSSAVCMDKEVANRLLDHAGIRRTPWAALHRRDYADLESRADGWESVFEYPMFVKPANSGSSVGVSKVKNRASLREAVDLAFAHDDKIIVERGIEGKELECAVLGNDAPFASVVSEIIPNNEFYDYDAKYNTPSDTRLPADIDAALSAEIRETAVRAYALLGCSGMARVDFLYEASSKTLYLNELNTIPGFTAISMYAKMMDASGVSYPQLLERLIDLAVERAADSAAHR